MTEGHRRLPGDPSPEAAVARMIRVDHAGEYGAARIYAGQLAVLRRSETAPVLREMQEQERQHLDRFADLIVRRRVRPTAVLPLWHLAGFALGAATAALGERAAMACTVAVEEAIDAHYADQIAALDDSEADLRNTLSAFRDDESAASRHRAATRRGAGARLSAVVGSDQGRLQDGDPDQRTHIGSAMGIERLALRDIDLEVLRMGKGPPILLLHGLHTVDPQAPYLDRLAAHAEIIAPSHPGFGHSPRPAGFDTVYDLVHLYLDLLETLPHEKVTLLGFSFGGWLAAEIAATCCHRLERLILVDPLGIKLGDRESRDILDLFNAAPAEVQRRTWHDPAKWAQDFNAMSDDAIVVHARNRDALCLYGWQPFMYNPKLPRWLCRIAVPTLLLWGASDGVVTPDYGRAYRDLIPGAKFELIEQAGHHPEIEQPADFAARVAAFLAADP